MAVDGLMRMLCVSAIANVVARAVGRIRWLERGKAPDWG